MVPCRNATPAAQTGLWVCPHLYGMCHDVAMRLHISLDDGLVRELDRRVGSRRRSAFIARAVERALDDERRWELIEGAIGSIGDRGHDWDDDPGAWVAAQRQADRTRVG